VSLILIILLAVAGAAYFAFTLGRATCDRQVDLNHRKMMLLLVDLQAHDSAAPIIPEWMRGKMARLLDEYGRLEPDDDQ
jgi:hypothetical protein